MKKRSIWLQWLFITFIGLIIARFCCDIFCEKVPEGYVLVEQATVDSLKAYIAIADSLEQLANLPPDTTVVFDTIYLDTTKTATTTPHQTSIDSSITRYSDSIKNSEIDVSIQFDVVGHLTSQIIWEYSPITKEKQVIVEKPVPYPVIETVEIKKPVPITGHYLSLAVGGNDKMFNFGVDYDVVQQNNIYGLQYRRYGDMNVYGVKVGINLRRFFKK